MTPHATDTFSPAYMIPSLVEAAASVNEAAYTLAREGLATCACGWSAMTEFASHARNFYDPAQFFEAQMALWAHLADLGAEAAGERLRVSGVSTPLLSDA